MSHKLNKELNEHLNNPVDVSIRMNYRRVNQNRDCYAVTFNIASGCFVNRKRWDDYSEQAQINLLSKILDKTCEKFRVIVDWSRFVIEQCPNSLNMHVHCVLKSTDLDQMECVSVAINSKYGPRQGSEYITLMYEELFCDEGWENYIRKNTR